MKFTRSRAAVIGLVATLAVGAGLQQKFRFERADASSAAVSAVPAARRIAVSVAPTRRGDMDIIVTALGTVTARETVTVRSRVEGELMRVHFREGQQVKAGALLAEIDPRPFQIALEQARGQLARDRALLDNARLDVARYRELLSQDSIAAQQVDAQIALVQQYEGVVQTDIAAVDNASLQLTYARITAPISGRLGLRQVDAGNIVRANDVTGLVVITATAPISVLFSVPSHELPAIRKRLREGASLTVEAFDSAAAQRLAQGRLLSLDNQIDTTTATLRLRAEFDNHDDALFPNQFVNVALHVATRDNVVLVPSAAVQRGQSGAFVYVVDAERRVQRRAVVIGPQAADEVVVESGLEAGESVVVEGVDKLRDGIAVEPLTVATGGTAPTAESAHSSP
jgi:multidrug efflux system membrane fusion protein